MLRMSFMIRRATAEDKSGWVHMRQGLWPEAPLEYLSFDLDKLLGSPDAAIFLASDEDGKLVGFLEAGLRSHGEGCESSPVGYIEAWYVDPYMRGQKLGRDLVYAAEAWAREKGCTEMASDTWLENEASIQAHLRMGYYEVERLVHFVKRL
jgi:aminoglycoside 6'-N-acetyltransferase I